LRVSDKTGNVITTVSVNDKDSGIITTSKGMVIRISCKDLRVMGRATQGVRIIKLRADDKVTDLAKVVDVSEVDVNGNGISNVNA
jgi:DNA gyrase subunit A